MQNQQSDDERDADVWGGQLEDKKHKSAKGQSKRSRRKTKVENVDH